MKNAVYRFPALLLVWAVIACSATPPTTPEVVAAADRIKGLEQSFTPASDEDRIRIAVELVRLGSSDPQYRQFLLDEAERALLSEEEAASEWRRQRIPHERNFAAASTQTVRYQASNVDRLPAPPQRATTIEREPDPTNLLPIVAVSMSATPDDSVAVQKLFRALRGSNVLLSSEAALGLARLKVKSAIPEVTDAAQRFAEPFLFGRALSYFGDPSADEAVGRLISDQELLRELRATARARNYDPYFQR